MHTIEINEKGQALAPPTQRMGAAAFDINQNCDIYWLGGGGVMLNCHGTVLMIDPQLKGFDMPLLRKPPLLPEEVLKLDGLLITHIDGDHFSEETCKSLRSVCGAYHTTHYVAEVMREKELDGIGHDIGECFFINDVKVTVTPVRHNWQNAFEEYRYREWKEDEYCGYFLETHGKTIWMPGDSKLMEVHLQMPKPDVILFDFSEDDWHITLEGAVKLANAYPDSNLICIHYGCIDAPEMLPFNGNPEKLFGKIHFPERIKVLAPGEKYTLNI